VRTLFFLIGFFSINVLSKIKQDDALIVFFDQNYIQTIPENCSVDPLTKSSVLEDIEKRCFKRMRSGSGKQYIAGFKANCNQGEAFFQVKSQISTFCEPQLRRLEIIEEEKKLAAKRKAKAAVKK
jgi:hypothetical protein